MTLTEHQVLTLLYDHLCGEFPKQCRRCGTSYHSLHEYVLKTEPLPRAISYDLDHEDGMTPIGSAVFANCKCGNTLSLSTSDLPVDTRLEFIKWASEEIARRGWEPEQFLDYLRERIRQRVLREAKGA